MKKKIRTYTYFFLEYNDKKKEGSFENSKKPSDNSPLKNPINSIVNIMPFVYL